MVSIMQIENRIKAGICIDGSNFSSSIKNAFMYIGWYPSSDYPEVEFSVHGEPEIVGIKFWNLD